MASERPGIAQSVPSMQTSLDLGDVFVREAPVRRTGGGRKPPLVRCRCGRQHRTWNPHKVCNRCVRESRSHAGEEQAAAAREVLRRLSDPTELERQELRGRLAVVHERWLSRQSLDHPWRVAGRGGEA